MNKGIDSPVATAAYKANPYSLYAQLRDETPVHKTVLPNGVEVYLVTRYADVLAGLKDDRLVKNIRNARPPGLLDKLGLDGLRNNNMLRADPPEHTRLRNLANAALSRNTLIRCVLTLQKLPISWSTKCRPPAKWI
jgi:cytochrome P450